VRDYSPKRRTALVFTGSGSTGAYHAGVLRALDESGVKIDVVVGSGVGALAAAFAAVGGGAKLYGRGGFWERAHRGAFYRLRPTVRLAIGLLGMSFAVFALPVLLGILLGILFPLLLIADRVFPGVASSALSVLWTRPEALSGPYLAAQAVPVFALAMLAIAATAFLYFRDRRRFAEAFESFLDAKPGLDRLKRSLWEVARGAALSGGPPSEAELGRRYVALLAENLGEPGFRELVLRATDLDRGGALAFVLLRDGEGTGPREREGALASAVDLRASGHGRVLTIASTSVLEPIPALALSNAIRPGVVGWMKTLAREVGADGVTVNVIAPGRIDTERLREVYPDGPAEADLLQIPLQRLGSTREIGDVAAFLASDRASYVTGTLIPVDGGLTRGLL